MDTHPARNGAWALRLRLAHVKEASTSPHLDGTSSCPSRTFSETVFMERRRRTRATASPANWVSDTPPDASA
jgi:hypothetical protein